jgi:Domain of unknown function (DUF4193)
MMAKSITGDEEFDDEDLSGGFEEVDEGFEVESDETDDGLESADEAVEDEDELSDSTLGGEDDDELALDQDVELALDQVLAEQMRVGGDLEDDDDNPAEPEAVADSSDTVLPKQDDEFRCKSCRLLKKLSQLADKKATLCRDCV